MDHILLLRLSRTIKSIIKFKNCLFAEFADNNRISLPYVKEKYSSMHRRGGIVFHYFVLKGDI